MESLDIKRIREDYPILQRQIEGRPLVIFISGNAKKFDLKNLGQYGKVQEVKYKDMIKF